MNTQDYCKNKAAPPGSNLYYSTLFCPLSLKKSVYALHAFANEVGDIFNECSDPGVARIKLHWWHDEIQRIYNKQARHPAGKELFKLLDTHSLNEDKLHQFVLFHEQILDTHQFETYEDLNNLLQWGPGLIWELTAELSGFSDDKTPKLANNLGCAIAVFEIIQNLHHHLSMGYMLLPVEEINIAGLTSADFINTKDNKSHEFLSAQIKRLIVHMEKIDEEYPQQDKYAQLCCLIMNRLIIKTCKEIEKDKLNLLQHKLSLTPLRKLWIAWRTKRQIISNM